MNEIKVSEVSLQKYSSNIRNEVGAIVYLPMQGGNISYSQANSINHFRTALFDLVDAVDNFQGVVGTDAKRLKELGASFTRKDQELERSMGLGGK
ncbi:DUF3130 domain-containing protein [Listeria marthii]|uniref:DUF3130 domain-containing protein n=1 Tax=Listeria marthii TaxID=529731 RepID=UPI0028803BA1|nr:DUF3130 domain-containing protein [Listeria marthii]MDT0090726.1 DUF3130 domain-containing protein [Listeria marthii]